MYSSFGIAIIVWTSSLPCNLTLSSALYIDRISGMYGYPVKLALPPYDFLMHKAYRAARDSTTIGSLLNSDGFDSYMKVNRLLIPCPLLPVPLLPGPLLPTPCSLAPYSLLPCSGRYIINPTILLMAFHYTSALYYLGAL